MGARRRRAWAIDAGAGRRGEAKGVARASPQPPRASRSPPQPPRRAPRPRPDKAAAARCPAPARPAPPAAPPRSHVGQQPPRAGRSPAGPARPAPARGARPGPLGEAAARGLAAGARGGRRPRPFSPLPLSRRRAPIVLWRGRAAPERAAPAAGPRRAGLPACGGAASPALTHRFPSLFPCRAAAPETQGPRQQR